MSVLTWGDYRGWIKWRAGNTRARARAFRKAPIRHQANYWVRRQADYPAQRQWWTASLIGLGILCPSFITTPIALYLAGRTGMALGYGAYGAVQTKTKRMKSDEHFKRYGNPYHPLSNGDSKMVFRPTDLERGAGTSDRPRTALKRLGLDPTKVPPLAPPPSSGVMSAHPVSGARSRTVTSNVAATRGPDAQFRIRGNPYGRPGNGLSL